MRIAYIGRVSLQLLGKEMPFNPALPDAKWGFPVGSEVVLGLLRRGHVVSVVTSDHRYKKSVCFRAKNCEIYILPERTTKLQFLTFFSREIRSIRQLLNLIKPDVIFAQWTYQNAYAGLTSGYPTLVVAHDSPWAVARTFRNAYGIFHAIYAQLFVFPRLRHVTAVSPHIADDLHRLNGFEGGIRVISNGVRIENKIQNQREKEIRVNAKTVVCVSQTGRLKNTQALIKAFELLKVKHPDWKLIMHGQGLPDGMVSREEVDRVLREEADVFCSPSLEESFGMVFIEAMMRGVPCVGGIRSGAVPWVLGVNRTSESRRYSDLTVGKGGVVCDVTDPNALADGIERLMLDYELRKELSVSGIRHVRENFNIEQVVDQYENELFRVLRAG